MEYFLIFKYNINMMKETKEPIIKIRNIRKIRKIKQNELAKKLGIIPQTLHKYENDIIEPNINMLKKLAKELNVSIDTLLDYDSGNLDLKMLTDNQRLLVDLVLRLTPDNEKRLIGYIEGILNKD